ncbi:MAG TPA: phosphoribosylamine--glycine ligase [Anaerolineaceae bacterium]
MNVMVIGSGGREHAIGWKLAQSPRIGRLFFAPGNAGTSTLGQNLTGLGENPEKIAVAAHERNVELVVIGPEAPLANGLADVLRARGLRVFGPSRAAAQIESSKRFAKEFMLRHGIPTARFAVFTDVVSAEAYLEAVDYPVVIKASGLAAGKGVFLPKDRQEARQVIRDMLLGGAFGAAGKEVLIEERLAGEEVSVLAFTDGNTVCPMPPAQDHKRLRDGDEGPNTGGMGAYAPAPICPPESVAEIVRTVLQPAVDGMRAEGCQFIGILYAGMMLTHQGWKVLEFNCRFGDPETQAILPLLESDLLEFFLACCDGHLDGLVPSWKPLKSICVVAASENYPDKPVVGRTVTGLNLRADQTVIFHAGTELLDGSVKTSGGRVLGITAWDASLKDAINAAYRALEQISFEGMQFRRDIGKKGLRMTYAGAGVDIDAGNRAVTLMKSAVTATYGPEVLAGVGAFGGLFDIKSLQKMKNPVLVASTDGVGTKVKLAAQFGSYGSIGIDLVNHCINDILVQGARPLFFLDYFASSHIDPEKVAEVVAGIAGACKTAGCALLGGETAEMPGVYLENEFDVAGTIIGVVEREQVLPKDGIQAGDVLLGLASSGAHTNGYSLIRRLFDQQALEKWVPELGRRLIDALLEPHRSYLDRLYPLLEESGGIKALAHLTGGGFIENIPRILPEELSARIERDSWQVPVLFRMIQQRGSVPEDEMYRVFNMGIGMVVVVGRDRVDEIQNRLGEGCWRIGEVIPLSGNHKVTLA